MANDHKTTTNKKHKLIQNCHKSLLFTVNKTKITPTVNII